MILVIFLPSFHIDVDKGLSILLLISENQLLVSIIFSVVAAFFILFFPPH